MPQHYTPPLAVRPVTIPIATPDEAIRDAFTSDDPAEFWAAIAAKYPDLEAGDE